jgi:hypothetical protein
MRHSAWIVGALLIALALTCCGVIQATPHDWSARLLNERDQSLLADAFCQTAGGDEPIVREGTCAHPDRARIAEIRERIKIECHVQCDGGGNNDRRFVWRFTRSGQHSALLLLDIDEAKGRYLVMIATRGNDVALADHMSNIVDEQLADG